MYKTWDSRKLKIILANSKKRRLSQDQSANCKLRLVHHKVKCTKNFPKVSCLKTCLLCKQQIITWSNLKETQIQFDIKKFNITLMAIFVEHICSSHIVYI